MILPALKQGAYQVEQQVDIGERLGGKKHKIDCMALKNNIKILISLKWQQSSGTAEQNIPYELMCLAKAVQEHKPEAESIKAYLVLGGLDIQGKRNRSKGWTLHNFYTKGGLNDYLHPDYAHLVEIVKTEEFIALANKSEL